jgi:transposase
MDTNFLTAQERNDLKVRHRSEKDRRTGDRIKAVLLIDEGWAFEAVAHALLVDDDTVRRHLKEYQESRKLEDAEHPGRASVFTDEQTKELIEYLNAITYVKSSDICAYVYQKYGINFSKKGMAVWLGKHGFVFKKPKITPKNADPEKQKKFVEEYEKLMNTTPEDEPILFGDAVHPTSETKTSYGWILKGSDKFIETTASRIRMNIMGALNLEDMNADVKEFDTINSKATIDFLEFLREKYKEAPYIHLILDNAGYYKTKEVLKKADELRIKFHFLPTRSPNLNPIERLWKVMNEKVRNNVSFENARDFRTKIREFFSETWGDIKNNYVDTINDNFHIITNSEVMVRGFS